MKYLDSPSRSTRRPTLTSGVGSGKMPVELSKVISTSATPLARRPSEPAKMTSCMLRAAHAARTLLAEHPHHRVAEVALAAAVGTDDHGDAGLEEQLGLLRERS